MQVQKQKKQEIRFVDKATSDWLAGKRRGGRSPEGARATAQDGRRVEIVQLPTNQITLPGASGLTTPEELSAAATSELPHVPDPRD